MSVEVIGLDSFLNELQRLAAELGDNRANGIWSVAERWFYAEETDLFASGGATGAHGRWPALSRRYAETRARRYAQPSPSPLERTGAARLALTHRGAEGDVNEATATELTMGAGGRVGYIRFHMERRGSRPARRGIDPSPVSFDRLGRDVKRAASNLVRSAAPMLKVEKE
jgi:hypothetical protein